VLTGYSDINALILDYLTLEGYPLAAAKFSKEANLQPQQEEESIQARQEIQHHIHAGNFEAAIESLNELDPTVCACSTLSPLPPLYVIKPRVIHAPRIVPFGL
jgi:hypothetical protein